ncbi:hypothetical protein [Micromonospora sp. NPDC050200]|uniref:hypothetical protein n=1 Tax=Micromonospora sp. NPDC050200 TaxID=3155664 RepID=UPI0033DB2F25
MTDSAPRRFFRRVEPARSGTGPAEATGGQPFPLTTGAPGFPRLLRAVAAVTIAGGPVAYLVGGVFSPSIHVSGQESIAASVAADPVVNAVHMVAFVLGSYLLPVGAVALAWLAWPRSPRLATVAGLLGVLGWLPFSALTALDDLINTAARSAGGTGHGALLDTFATDTVMGGYLLVYIVFHLVAYVLFGVALRRAGILPRWAAWSMIASSPLTVVAFALPISPRLIGAVAVVLLVLGSLPAAVRAWRG